MSTNTAKWVGTVLADGRYEVSARLGAGGMGFVYQAHDHHLNCEVVIKVPRLALVQQKGFTRRFAHEVRSLVQLTHPHIVKILDVGEHAGIPFAVMQYLAGGSLRDRLPVNAKGERMPMPLSQIVGWIEDVAAALTFIHAQNYVHRDVKPENILFDQHGNIYLSDFGLAKALAQGNLQSPPTALTVAGAILGTPHYMAPELAMGKPCDGRADQYALGVMVYELLGGRLPFDGATVPMILALHISQQPPRLEEAAPTVPQAVSAAVHRALAKEPGERFPDCVALAEVMRSAVGSTTARAAQETSLPSNSDGIATRVEPVARVSVTCPECRKAMAVPTGAEGKRLRCPHCQTVFAVTGTPGNRPSDPGPRATGETLQPRQTPSAPHPSKPSSRPSSRTPQAEPGPERSEAKSGSRNRPATSRETASPIKSRRGRVLVLAVVAGLFFLAAVAGVGGAGWWLLGRRGSPKPGTVNPVVRAGDLERFGLGRPHAVLIGINDPLDRSLKGRTHAEDDVRALYDLVTDPDRLGVDKSNVRLLLGRADSRRQGQLATRDNILKAVRWVVDSAGPDDLVLVAFVGTGGALSPAPEDRCLFALDSTMAGAATDAIGALDLGTVLQALKSRHLCALLDISMQEGGTMPGADAGFAKAATVAFLGDAIGDTYRPHLAGRRVMLASDALASPPSAANRGAFMQVVIDALQGAADREGDEADGVITTDELSSYLAREMPELVRRNGGPNKGWRRPGTYQSERSRFAVILNPDALPQSRDRLDKFGSLTREGRVTPEIAQEGALLLAETPRLATRRRLRKEYQALADGRLTVAQFLDNRGRLLTEATLPPDVASAFTGTVMKAANLAATNYVKEVNRGELVAASIRSLYRTIEESPPDALATRLVNAKGVGDAELNDLLRDARLHLGKREDLDKQQDLLYALHGLTTSLDRHCRYVDPESLAQYAQTTRGNFSGIGIQIQHDFDLDLIKVVTPIWNSPAYKAGLQAGDLITTITREVDDEGQPLPVPQVIPTRGLAIAQATRHLMGKENTSVKVTVQRPQQDRPLEFSLRRGRVKTETVVGLSRRADATWEHFADVPNRIACIRLRSFGEETLTDLTELLNRLESEGLRGLVLDLRNNLGGLMESSIAVSDLFIGDGAILTSRGRMGNDQSWSGKQDGSHLAFPMVCLINGQTASGSEIVAACLQDHQRARIAGERSYGKGSAQTIFTLEELKGKAVSQLQLTTMRYYRPSGRNLERTATTGLESEEWGVRPDLEVPLTHAERAILLRYHAEQEIIRPKGVPGPARDATDRQLDAALRYLREQIKRAPAVG